MVSVQSILMGCALVALSSSSIQAARIGSTPVTADTRVLSRHNPAFGARYQPTVRVNATIGLFEEESADDAQQLASALGVDSLETNPDNLPKRAETNPVPWPSSYWPVYEDGINARWNNGDASAAEKYARAYGLDVQEFMDNISRNNGILGQSRQPECSSDNDCEQGSRCGIRDGESSGHCIPTWFGVCHAWAPAALLEAEPKCPVTVNDVTFEVFDIKALLTQVYDGAEVPTFFAGARYDGPQDVSREDNGRPSDPAFRDLNPGFFHIAMANILGLKQRGFVLDVDAGPQVWNQPIRGYEVLELTSISREDAGAQFFNAESYPYNDNASGLLYAKTAFSWILESGETGPTVSTGLVDGATKSVEFEYILELDGLNNIIGGEWVGNSVNEHPDFLWFPQGRPSDDVVTNVNLSVKNVHDLLDQSINSDC